MENQIKKITMKTEQFTELLNKLKVDEFSTGQIRCKAKHNGHHLDAFMEFNGVPELEIIEFGHLGQDWKPYDLTEEQTELLKVKLGEIYTKAENYYKADEMQQVDIENTNKWFDYGMQ